VVQIILFPKWFCIRSVLNTRKTTNNAIIKAHAKMEQTRWFKIRKKTNECIPVGTGQPLHEETWARPARLRGTLICSGCQCTEKKLLQRHLLKYLLQQLLY
jgi:hypothetical protein